MDKFVLDGHKLYWHLDRVLEWQKKGITPPIYMEVSPVGYCNNRCIFCGVDFAMDNKSSLDTDAFCRSLAEMGRQGVRSMMFAGEGEPLLHKDIRVLIQAAKQSGIDVSMTTNGTRGTYDMWKEILPHLTWIRFSVDAGSPEIYSRVHGVPESSFSQVVRSISDAMHVKHAYNLDVTIGVQYLIIHENLSDIGYAIDMFSEMNVNYFSLKPYSYNPKMIKKRDELYTEETARYIENIIERHRNGGETIIIFRKSSLGKYMEGNTQFEHCYALPFYGYISSAGDFYTCKEFIGDERFRAGNIYDDDLESIFYGKQRSDSIRFGENGMRVKDECRLNCRMARINEFLESIGHKPEHVNFI